MQGPERSHMLFTSQVITLQRQQLLGFSAPTLVCTLVALSFQANPTIDVPVCRAAVR